MLLVRPEDLRLAAPSSGGGQVLGTAQVEATRYHGHDSLVTARLAEVTVTVRALGPTDARPGDEVLVLLAADPLFLTT